MAVASPLAHHQPVVDSARKFLVRQTVADKFVGWSQADSCQINPDPASEYFGFTTMNYRTSMGMLADEGVVEVFTADGKLLDTYDLDFLRHVGPSKKAAA